MTAGIPDQVAVPYPRWGRETTIERRGEPALTLRALAPEPPDQAMAIVLLVHGMNEYVGRYRHVAEHFARRFAVVGFDLHGHGLSNPVLAAADRAIRTGAGPQPVGDAYLAGRDLGDLDPLRDDLRTALDAALAMFPRLPLLIIAHSLGALVSCSLLLGEDAAEVRDRLAGIALLGPAFAVSQVPDPRGALANALIDLSFNAECWRADRAAASPARPLHQGLWAVPTSLLLNGLFELLSAPGLRRIFTPSTPAWVVEYLSDCEIERGRQRSDGYIIRRSLLRYVKAIEREIARFRCGGGPFDIPYMLVYSRHDPITPAAGALAFAETSSNRHPDNEVFELPDAFHHEHLFSAAPLDRMILQRLDDWFDRRLRAR